MSVGGSSNLGTLLIRRLDTALSVQASQQSQIVNAARSDAIAQLADAARISPVHNEGGRPLPETIDKAQAQVERKPRPPADAGRLQPLPPGSRQARAAVDASSTPSAPTRLGHAARTILALLALFPDHAPPMAGRKPLLHSAPGQAGGSANNTVVSGGTSAATSTLKAAGSGTSIAGAGTAANHSAPVAATAGASAGSSLATQIMSALSLALQQSGAFYESHLHDLTFGKRDVAQLRQEPQGGLRVPAGPASSQAPAATGPEAAPSSAQGGPAPESAPTEGRSTATNPTSAGAAGSQSLAGLHPETQPIVRQQLEILASQVFGWRGEAWPDAPMQWEIARRNEDDLPDETGTHWATSLKLQLPSLGEVEARLSLYDKQVVMRLIAPESASTLSNNDEALRAGFSEAGLTLSQLTILQESDT